MQYQIFLPQLKLLLFYSAAGNVICRYPHEWKICGILQIHGRFSSLNPCIKYMIYLFRVSKETIQLFGLKWAKYYKISDYFEKSKSSITITPLWAEITTLTILNLFPLRNKRKIYFKNEISNWWNKLSYNLNISTNYKVGCTCQPA